MPAPVPQQMRGIGPHQQLPAASCTDGSISLVLAKIGAVGDESRTDLCDIPPVVRQYLLQIKDVENDENEDEDDPAVSSE